MTWCPGAHVPHLMWRGEGPPFPHPHYCHLVQGPVYKPLTLIARGGGGGHWKPPLPPPPPTNFAAHAKTAARSPAPLYDFFFEVLQIFDTKFAKIRLLVRLQSNMTSYDKTNGKVNF